MAHPGTNTLSESFGLVGYDLLDPCTPERRWEITHIYPPVLGRAIGGLRAKLVDQKGFISFCNQRDLEVLIGDASPGEYCPWLGLEYPDHTDRSWVGLCVDEEDLLDDLYDRELEAREQFSFEGLVLPTGLSFQRQVHDGPSNDYNELMTLLWDMCRETNIGPDTRRETVGNRWSSVERTHPRDRATLWWRWG